MKFHKNFAGAVVGARILTLAVTTATVIVAPFPLFICSDIAIQEFFPDIKRRDRGALSLALIAAGEGIILLAGGLIFFGLDKLREEPPEEE